jgi:hypothetical protein
MGFFYSNDGRSFSTTLSYDINPQILLTPKGVDDTRAAMIIQSWWRQYNPKTKKQQKASICIQTWWRLNRTFQYYYLFIDNSKFYIEELYDRLLTVIVPGIEYICVKKKDTFPKCILLKTDLHKSILDYEIKHVLLLIGYNYQFVLNKN